MAAQPSNISIVVFHAHLSTEGDLSTNVSIFSVNNFQNKLRGARLKGPKYAACCTILQLVIIKLV